MANLGKTIYVYKLCKSKADQGHSSVLRQFMEMAWLRATTGISYATYHYARMWRRDADWQYKTGFMSMKQYKKEVWRLNDRKFHGVSQYKPLEKAYFRLFALKTPPYLGFFHITSGKTPEGNTLSSQQDLETFLANKAGKMICFKKVEGHGGRGFMAFKIIPGNDAPLLQQPGSEDQYTIGELYGILATEPDGWLIEEYLVQHPEMARLNSSSVNTLRMHVYQDSNNKIHILGTRLRVGAAGSLVDNNELGGISANVNIETGVVELAYHYSPEMNTITHHPDSGEQVVGFVVPYWEEAKNIGADALRHMPKTRFLGLDIAITEQGPVMIEMNIEPSMNGLSTAETPIRHIFRT
ncbi:sugar-transfer associated ATP-grasp domain-containing protein [Emcibacter sp.]|uniref:sugar-transfer associated ATP-grasp domain-containing protein n=1 Tax=Emcibacter sp. TaxID=1979954 RepID=UPI002AA78961|nr:sugar-transfer associated ATP-grasp domain-containing protein [Emcibacter sp.]